MAKTRNSARGPSVKSRLRAKARQAMKLAEIREALITAGCNTTAKQASVLGVGRSTAWALLNRDKRAGPSSVVLKRILSSPNLPSTVRGKFEEYIGEKMAGRYGHGKRQARWFRGRFNSPPPSGREVRESIQLSL